MEKTTIDHFKLIGLALAGKTSNENGQSGRDCGEIWESNYDRAYTADFEVYGTKSMDWDNAEIDIFLSVK